MCVIIMSDDVKKMRVSFTLSMPVKFASIDKDAAHRFLNDYRQWTEEEWADRVMSCVEIKNPFMKESAFWYLCHTYADMSDMQSRFLSSKYETLTVYNPR